MNFTEYSHWMSIAAVIFLLAMLVVSRLLRNTVLTKPKLQKGSLIIAITVSAILLIWGILYEVFR
ncbi:MAG TPA: hypothetical protein VM577_04885 [Anaerovoracaceae bacterium]|nr:hypothetical protein [Anaerovoracaceae bacterium]